MHSISFKVDSIIANEQHCSFLFSGIWEPLNFPNPPSARYGMASASSLGNGLYIFGGFGMQGSSYNLNPYMGYGMSGLPTYRQNPAGGTSKKNPEVDSKQNPAVAGKQYSNQMNPMGYNNYNDNDDRSDENFYPLQDSWYLNYM